MTQYDDEYRGYLIAYISNYTLTAIYEKTRWGPSAIYENAYIGRDEKMSKAKRQKELPKRARAVIDNLIAKKTAESAAT